MPACMFCTTFLVGIATLHPFASVTSLFCIATTIVCVVEDGSLSSVRRERERESCTTRFHMNRNFWFQETVSEGDLCLCCGSQTALSLSPWCPWRSGMKRDTTTRSPCGLFEYFNWVASAAASKLNYPDYLF